MWFAFVCISIPCIFFLVTWVDLGRNSANLLGNVPPALMFVAIFLVMFLMLYLQFNEIALGNIISELGLLIGTIIMIPVIVAVFAYAYLAIPSNEYELGADHICPIDHTSECLYFSAVTFTTLGYGDVTPTGTSRIYAIAEAFLGFSFVPLLLAQLINFLADVKASARNRIFRKRLERLKEKRSEELEALKLKEEEAARLAQIGRETRRDLPG